RRAAPELGWSCFPGSRPHTRWPRDWSSDVCSSDLADLSVAAAGDDARYLAWSSGAAVSLARSTDRGKTWQRLKVIQHSSPAFLRSEERRVGKERRPRWSRSA